MLTIQSLTDPANGLKRAPSLVMKVLSLRTQIFVSMVGLLGLLCQAHALYHWQSSDLGKFVVYFLLSLLVSRMKVKLPGIDGSMSVGFLFILIAIVELRYPEALLLAAISTLVQSVWKAQKRPQAIHVIFNVTSIVLATAASYAVYHAMGSWGINRIFSLASAASIYFLLNTFPVSLVISLSESKSVRRIWSECYFWSFPYYLVGASIAGLCGWLSHVVGWESSLLVLPVVYLIYRSYFLYLEKLADEKRRVEAEKKHVEDMASLHMRTIEALALAIEAKDTTTHNHLQRVRIYALELGKLLDISHEDLDALRAAALLHDIGKLGVPEHIISKPGKLTPEEFEKMKIHPVIGAEILERVKFPYPVVPIVRAHHEKWDGTGYPYGLSGEQIPVGARILSAVDCLDALASHRQYRRALPLDEAMNIVLSESGKSFDPRVVEVLRRHYVALEKLVQEKSKEMTASELSLDIRVAPDAAPDAGYEGRPPVEATSDFIASIASARQEAQTLYELSQDLGSSLRLADTLSLVAARLARLIPYDSLCVSIPENSVLVPAYVTGDNFRALRSQRVPMGEGLVGWVAANRKPIVNGDPAVEYGYQSDESKATLRSALSIPLESIEGLVGVLTLYSQRKEAFTREHVRVLLAVNSRLALAIENAIKYEEAESSSVTDYLTGLPNARSLFVHLDKEMARAQREKASLAVLVCDLDGFKEVNDRFGHLTGNNVLRRFAERLQEVCRQYDYVARMGGDEFVLVIPGVTTEAAQERAALINDVARTTGRQICNSDLLSASVGVAIYPGEGEDADALLSHADRRMYSIKQGKHRKRPAIATLSEMQKDPALD